METVVVVETVRVTLTGLEAVETAMATTGRLKAAAGVAATLVVAVDPEEHPVAELEGTLVAAAMASAAMGKAAKAMEEAAKAMEEAKEATVAAGMGKAAKATEEAGKAMVAAGMGKAAVGPAAVAMAMEAVAMEMASPCQEAVAMATEVVAMEGARKLEVARVAQRERSTARRKTRKVYQWRTSHHTPWRTVRSWGCCWPGRGWLATLPNATSSHPLGAGRCV